MPTPVRLPRPQRAPLTARRAFRPSVSAPALRTNPIVADRGMVVRAEPASSWPGFQPDPYFDYGRFLTHAGGILILYKDLDLRFRHTLLRLLVWSIFTGPEGWYLLYRSPVDNFWINLACLAAVAIVNWLIVAKPVELYRSVEIRPDCLILEGADIFWLKHMEGGWPAFSQDPEGNYLLTGIYGTRFVEYLTARRFDELDRMPETFVAHLQEAMKQLWSPPGV